MLVELCQSHFLTILYKNLAAVGVLRINIWLFIPVPKIKFDPPPHGKNALGLIFYAFHKIDNFFPDMEILSKN